MRMRHGERQYILDVFRDELEDAKHRIEERVARFGALPATHTEDAFDGVRRFYEDLVDKSWTQADEDALRNLSDLSDGEIKRRMREAFRLSPVHPVPSFFSLMNVLRKGEAENKSELSGVQDVQTGTSSLDRERLANLLSDEFSLAAQEITVRLSLDESNAKLVREEIEIAQGHVISRFTPLV